MEINITNIKVTGGSGRKPVKFKFQCNGKKFEEEFETREGWLQGNGIMGTRMTKAQIVDVRIGSRQYGTMEIWKIKSVYSERERKEVAEWIYEVRTKED